MGTGLTPLRPQMTRSIAALLALWGQTTRNPLDLLKTQLQTVQTQRESVSDESRLFFLGIVAAAVLVLRLDGAVLRNEIDGMRFMIISVSASLISRHDGRILTFFIWMGRSGDQLFQHRNTASGVRPDRSAPGQHSKPRRTI